MKSFDKLVAVIKKLRSKNGCPWDKKQTHKSLKPYIIEEAYELLHAIDKKDDFQIMDELGDVLLQVLLHAQILSERKKYDIKDVINNLKDKMIRRHPHVFSNKKVKNIDIVWKNWEKIKSKEKNIKSILDSIPKSLPALYRADKTQKKVARVGFDWDNVAGAWDKVFEELNEIKEIISSKKINKAKLAEEMGDLLFSIVNVARKLGLNSEEVLHKSIEKFSRRFFKIENYCKKQKIPIEKLSIDQLENLWQLAKVK